MLAACGAIALLASHAYGADLDARRSTGPIPVASSPGRPAGPAADLSQEITGGSGPFMGAASKKGLKAAGYVEREYVASGTATSYRADGGLPEDGRWTFVPDSTAAYRTRVLVRRPAKPAAFSGTVVVEWLNVSGGLDADPDYTSLRDEILRQGDVWVGVSAQLIGVEGGPVIVTVPAAADLQGKGLKALDPMRYGSLAHPGDGYSFDMFTQVERAIRAGGPGMGGLKPKWVVAVGESQSALALTTYINGVQPLTRGFDGFFVHSRASVPLPMVRPGGYADLRGGILRLGPAILRTDTDVPVLELQAESDVTSVLDSVVVRQPDTDHFRLWEVAGTSHADVHLLGSVAKTIDCGAPLNDGPMHVVAKAALHSLDRWIRTGEAPPKAPRIQMTSAATPEIRRNTDGIAQGGVRTPPVDVPTVVLSGVPGPNPDLLCILLGSTKPLPAERLDALYPSRTAYQDRYEAATQKAIKAGFVLEADRAALQAFAIPSRVER